MLTRGIDLLTLKNIGRFESFRLALTDGEIVEIRGDNDEGKSTIPASIETLIFGKIYEKTSTEKERVLLNALVPGVYRIERNDGEFGNCHVVQQTDALGQPIRMVIAVPAIWLSNAEQAQMPRLVQHLAQLTEPQTAAA